MKKKLHFVHVQYIGEYQPDYFAELLDAEIDGNLATVTGEGGLGILDISDPANIVELAHYQDFPAFHRFYHSVIDGPYIYASARENGCAILDATDPANPVKASEIRFTVSSMEGITVDENTLYAAMLNDGLFVFDVTNPYNPQPAGAIFGLKSAWVPRTSGDNLFVADGQGTQSLRHKRQVSSRPHRLREYHGFS